MRVAVLAVVAAAGLIAGCHSTTPVEFCDDFENEVCVRVFECWDAATQAGADFQSHYGTSVQQCQTRLKTNNCGAVTNSQPCAGQGQTFHANDADACVADLKAASCTAITSPPPNNFMSSNCDAVCS